MKVLIIEQEKTLQQSLGHFFRLQLHSDVFLANSGAQGMSLFEEVPFDLVLCGERLPDINGLELLKKMVKKKPTGNFVFMTARGDEAVKEEAFRAGIRGYLEKPFDISQIEEIMDSIQIRMNPREPVKLQPISRVLEITTRQNVPATNQFRRRPN